MKRGIVTKDSPRRSRAVTGTAIAEVLPELGAGATLGAWEQAIALHEFARER